MLHSVTRDVTSLFCVKQIWKIAAISLAAVILSGHALAQSEAARKPPKLIINYGGGGWKDSQVQEPCILVNPKDPHKLIMFFSGGTAKLGTASLGKAWAEIGDPTSWHEDPGNPIFEHDAKITFESEYVRLDSVIYDRATDEYWIYYTGHSAQTHTDAIGLVTCPAGRDGYSDVNAAHMKRCGANPILTPGGPGRADETFVSQGAVIREVGQWYLFYSYRTAAKTLPGIRLSTSADGVHWQKQLGPDLITAAPETLYFEWHQISRIDDRYVMLLEGYNGGKRWGADVAVSDKLTSGWTKLPTTLIDQTTWPGYSDNVNFHVATPAIYQFNGHWYLYFQAAHSGYYIVQHWAMYCVGCDDVERKIVAGPLRN